MAQNSGTDNNKKVPAENQELTPHVDDPNQVNPFVKEERGHFYEETKEDLDQGIKHVDAGERPSGSEPVIQEHDGADPEQAEPDINSEEFDPGMPKRDEFILEPDHVHEGTEDDLRHPGPNSLKMTFALAGQQNSGKTTLFNYLTGSNQHVGNWPGVTVEHKDGIVKGMPGVTVVDLPGIYSLSPYTEEEMVTRNYVIDQKPDAIINIVDATNLERNLYLTVQLEELSIPMVIALNMMDEVMHEGDVINVEGLENDLGVPVVPISAKNGSGVHDLIEKVVQVAIHNEQPPARDICEGDVHIAVHSIGHLIEDKAVARHYSPRFVATKLIEGDEPVRKEMNIPERESHIIEEIIEHMEYHTGMDREASIADARYKFIEKVSTRNLKRKRSFGEMTASNKIDRVVTNKWLALPIFLCAMLLVFWITFGPIGTFLQDGLTTLIDAGIAKVGTSMTAAGFAPWVRSLVVDGALAGVGSVLSFLPVIVLLFLCLSILEDCGYMARVAFIMDKLLRKLGLSGRSFISMIMGFGCTVPAVMGSRTLENKQNRIMTILLTPFMSCGAKVPVYTIFIAAFFVHQNKTMVMFSFYVLGMVLAVITALILKRTIFRGKPAPFIIELPPYRIPTPQSVWMQLWMKAKDFLERATTTILIATMIIWFLGSFNLRFYMVDNKAESILAMLGGWIAPLFKPAGFGDWRPVTALVTGLMAKESVISSMAILYDAGQSGMTAALNAAFTPLSAVSFLVFFLLYPPCVAAMATIKREAGRKWAAFSICYQTLIAWTMATLVYQIGSLFIR